jgi:hypothetical protein
VLSDELRAAVPVVVVGSHRHPYAVDRYMAVIAVAGRPTTFDCTHLHHSAGAARRCVRALAASWAEWADDERTTCRVVPDVPGLFELSQRTERGGMSQRWRYDYDVHEASDPKEGP